VHRISLLTSLAVAASGVRIAATQPLGDTGDAAGALTDAPPADKASGIDVPAPRESHPIGNTLLAIPRITAHILLLGPRYAAAEVDDYLESRSPNAFGRDVKETWRFGASLEWEKELGVSAAARVGRSFGRELAIDGYAGGFGARGESGGLRARLGSYTGAHLQPELSFDAGTDLARAFGGIDMRGPLGTYELGRGAASAALRSHVGSWQAGVHATADHERTSDPDRTFMDAYDPTLVGFAETQNAATGELAFGYDSRRPSYRWIRRSAPSTGTFVRASLAHTDGTGSRSGDFAFETAGLELRRLFDLFHGDRVLSLGASMQAVTRDDIPFDRLPSVGGAERMRAFARDELRARALAYGDITYEWPLGPDSRAFVFVEGTRTPRSTYADYGGGVRLLSGASTAARVQVAASPTGDLGVFFQLGAL
jgi:hypothetical protein